MNKITMTITFCMLFLLQGCVGSVDASKYDKSRGCWGAIEEITSIIQNGCDDGSVIKKDENGDYWKFFTGCTPRGYEDVPNDVLFTLNQKYCE